MGRKATDETGHRYGSYLVLGRNGSTNSKAAAWLCRCDCGEHRTVAGNDLRKGNVKSCGSCPTQNPCSVVEDGEPCDRGVEARGYCQKHYARWRKYGDPLVVVSRTYTKIQAKVCPDCGVKKSRAQFGEQDGRIRSVCRECMKARGREWWSKNRSYQISANRKRLYGLTPRDHEQLLANQGGVCAICGQEEKHSNQYGQMSLSVDHDHDCCPGKTSCGKCVRGLLCSKCNHGLGNFGDSPEQLLKAAAYLLAHATLRVTDLPEREVA
jgi:hypothetical protein